MLTENTDITYLTGRLASRLTAVVSLTAAVFVICVMTLCSCRKDVDDTRAEEHRLALKAVDDSVAVNAPTTGKIIERGLAAATDSMDYYDWYLRRLRYAVSLNMPDTSRLDWTRAFAFLNRRPETPRVRGMQAFLYNVKGYYYHKFHYNPHETIHLYDKAYRLLFGSDSEDGLPNVCANLGDAYVSVNDMPRAALWYRRALLLADSLRLPAEDNVSLYMGLGRIYLNLNDLEAARECYVKTDENFDKMPLNMKLYFLNNYGNYHYYAKDYRSALAMFMRLKRLLDANGMAKSYEMYLCKINMADTYLNLGDADRALALLDEVDPFFRKLGDDTGIYYANTIRIGIELKRNNVGAVKKIIDGEHFSTPIDFNMVNIRRRYLREYHVKKGEYKEAYDNLLAFIQYNDSLKHNLIRMRTSEIMMRYTQDTLSLHHRIAMQEKDASLRKSLYGIYIGASSAIVLALLLFLYVAYARKRRLQMYMRLMSVQLTDARRRISPHFIFNVLNNRISRADSRDADELMQLVRLIRAGLGMSGKSFVSLKEELDFVKYYIGIERTCIGQDFVFTIDAPTDDVLEQIAVPSMFVQILVENAIKHGLKGLEGDKRLTVSVKTDASRCRISVIDNGKGFDIRHRNENSTGTGLKVIRSTIALLNRTNKHKISLSINNLRDERGNIKGCEAALEMEKGMKKDKWESDI